MKIVSSTILARRSVMRDAPNLGAGLAAYVVPDRYPGTRHANGIALESALTPAANDMRNGDVIGSCYNFPAFEPKRRRRPAELCVVRIDGRC